MHSYVSYSFTATESEYDLPAWAVADCVSSLGSKDCLITVDNRSMYVSAVAADHDVRRSPVKTAGCHGASMSGARQRWASTLWQHLSASSASSSSSLHLLLVGQWSRVTLSTVRYSLSSRRPISMLLSASSGKLVTSLMQTTHSVVHYLHHSQHTTGPPVVVLTVTHQAVRVATQYAPAPCKLYHNQL